MRGWIQKRGVDAQLRSKRYRIPRKADKICRQRAGAPTSESCSDLESVLVLRALTRNRADALLTSTPSEVC